MCLVVKYRPPPPLSLAFLSAASETAENKVLQNRTEERTNNSAEGDGVRLMSVITEEGTRKRVVVPLTCLIHHNTLLMEVWAVNT